MAKSQAPIYTHARRKPKERPTTDFRHLVKAIGRLSKQFKAEKFDKGQQLYRPGDPAHFFYVLKSGQVKTSLLLRSGKAMITQVLRPGDFWGQYALIEGRPHEEVAESLQNCRIWRIPGDLFLRSLEERPELHRELLLYTSIALRESRQDLAEMAYSSVRRRLVLRMLAMTRKGQRRLKLKRGDLACATGTTKETVVRILSELREDGLIETDKSSVRLKAVKRLRKLAKGW